MRDIVPFVKHFFLCRQFCLSMPTLFLSPLERSVCQSISPSSVGNVHQYVFVFLKALLGCLSASFPNNDAVCQYVFPYHPFVCLSVKCLAHCTLSLNQCFNVHCGQTIKGPIFRSSTCLLFTWYVTASLICPSNCQVLSSKYTRQPVLNTLT